MSIVSFHDVSLILANVRILDHVDWRIQAQDKIALVGRNGAGKSTLLKLLLNEIVQDSGQIHRKQGLRVAGLTQMIPHSDKETVYHFLVKGLGASGLKLAEYHDQLQRGHSDELIRCQMRLDEEGLWDQLPRIDSMASKLGLEVNATMKHLSGGMKRRALLAASLIANPDLLLLDEPTNHLDIDSIEWLESYLKNYSGSYLVVTHDREFLAQVATQIVEIDRGKLHTFQCDYSTYLDRRESMRLSEQKEQDLFDKRLQDEETWIRTGIKARRTRNEGRVRALKAMREASRQRRTEMGKAKAITLNEVRSGQLVIEAKHVNHAFQNNRWLNDFSLLITRGDKIGIIGPNGCGKTSLLRILLGQLSPNSGEVRHGTSLAVAYFDQLRSEVDDKKSMIANVAEGSDYVEINGRSKHVASYLKDFLFSPNQFNQPVSILSGGERNRLLLAKLLAKPVNLLVMDEPTNDLDMETLDLLESMLFDYNGSLLIVSHDRAFINQVTTSILVYEDDGCFHEYMSGYDDYRQLKKVRRDEINASAVKMPVRQKSTEKLTFKEQRELNDITRLIDQLEKTIESLQFEMAQPSFYQRDSESISLCNKRMGEYESKLNELYARWEVLEEKR